jgi:MoaA/NifB/PqqE/SkfB family radical SAM enzyme
MNERALRDGVASARRAIDLAAAALLQPHRPLVTHLVVTRRCNLSCGYCFEYDKVSPPVPRAALEERIGHLARLRSVFVTLTGGETLLHPDAAALVASVRERGMTPFLNSNGFLLTRAHIRDLGAAGLHAMQLSIDGALPNATTMKTLKPLLPKLRLLADHASFRVRVNTVLGASPPEEAVEVTRAALALGFDASCSLARHGDGSIIALDARARRAYDEIRALGRRAPVYLDDDFTVPLLRDGHLDWKCRAGARTFLVCEDGLVHMCAPRFGQDARPLADYDEDDLRRAFDAPKPCATTCPIAYAHHASRFDQLRPQRGAPIAVTAANPLVDAKRLVR